MQEKTRCIYKIVEQNKRNKVLTKIQESKTDYFYACMGCYSVKNRHCCIITPEHPPLCGVSWEDAKAYAKWISENTGLKYRLPSEAEWEYAARAATTTTRYWPENNADEKDAACTYANVFDAKNESRIKNTFGGINWNSFKCEDDYPFTAPVGLFVANDWGLHDMLGNVWEWNQDCYIKNYKNAPGDGSSRESADNSKCSLRLLRGGSWTDVPQNVRSANRYGYAPDYRNYGIGFRLARTL